MKFLVSINIPNARLYGLPSPLRTLLDWPVVPRKGDSLFFPGGPRLIDVDEVRFRTDGRIEVVVNHPAHIVNVVGDSPEEVKAFHDDLTAAGWSVMTDWDSVPVLRPEYESDDPDAPPA